jgi:UDP-N-acetylmuramoyl-tripeptide--D-alanyl-D-alanine ligase
VNATQRVWFVRPSSTTPESIVVPLLGEAGALNVIGALAAAECVAGAPVARARIEEGLAALEVPGRLRPMSIARGITLLDDSYNANPSSFAASLASLDELAGSRRKVVVLGEMKELGALAEEAHAELGEWLASRGVSLAIGCGGPLVERSLTRAARQGVATIACASSSEAAEVATSRVLPGDVVLVKGSRSVGTERVVTALAEAEGRR